MAIELGDYNTVPERIAEFRTKYPDGSLQPADLSQPYRIEQIGDRFYVVVVAAAYRTPDDARPGIGMAYEQWPGRTPYTKDSELQNAETSAWGRAIVAALAADTKRSIASAEDVRNRQADREWEEAQAQGPGSPAAIELFAAVMDAKDSAALRKAWEGIRDARTEQRINEREAVQLNNHVKRRQGELEARRDSTGDGDGGGAEPGAAGPGSGPDRAGAGERGPGRDGEEGGVRPGVQSGVHRGDGSGGAAQAPRGGRGAPTATGGGRG